MTAGTIHNTSPAALRLPGLRLASGGAAHVDDVTTFGDLPHGALFVPDADSTPASTDDPAAQLAALSAGAADPAGYTVAEVTAAIASLTDPAAVTAIAKLEQRGKARTTIAHAADARVAELTVTEETPAS